MQTNTTSRALAAAVWPQNANRTLQSVVLVLAGTAIIAAAAKIQVPFWPVPLTLQTLAVMLVGATYGSRLAAATLVAYILEGMAGLPVFAGAVAGPAYLLGPTAGFIWGWIPMAAIIGYAADRGWDRSMVRLFAVVLAADALDFALGLGWLGHAVPTIGYSQTLLETGLYPFVLGDLLKIALVALSVPAGWALMKPKS